MFHIVFGNAAFSVVHRWTRYQNGRPALLLVDAVTYEPIIKASINLVDEPMTPDEMAINHDFADVLEPALVAAKIIEPHHRTVIPNSSFVPFKIARVIDRDMWGNPLPD